MDVTFVMLLLLLFSLFRLGKWMNKRRMVGRERSERRPIFNFVRGLNLLGSTGLNHCTITILVYRDSAVHRAMWSGNCSLETLAYRISRQ